MKSSLMLVDPTTVSIDRGKGPLIEDAASTQLWRARLGVPGIYRVDPTENETFFFSIWSCLNVERARIVIKVIPISLWEDGDCIEYIPPLANQEHSMFLPASVMYGRCNYESLPEKDYNELELWCQLAEEGFMRHDKLRRRNQHS